MPGLDVPLLAACGLLGLLAGFLGGLLGIGGGVVIVPALLVLFDHHGLGGALVTPMAVATSLATIVFTSLAAARAQLRRGAVEWSLVRRWTPGLLLGGALAGPLAARLPGVALQAFLGVFLGAAALVLLTRWQPAPHRRHPGPGGSFAVSGVAGLISGLAGIGGGNVVVPSLAFLNVPMQRATATSSTLGVPISIAGTTGFVVAGLGVAGLPPGSLGFVYLPAAAAIAAAAFLCAPFGVALAHRIPALVLRRVFGGLLVVVAGRLLLGVLGGG